MAKEVAPATLDPKEAARRANQRKRSVAIGLVLAVIVAIFYVLTIVKLGPDVFLKRDL